MAKKRVIINNKAYKMPEFNFGDIRKLEKAGCPILNLAKLKENVFSALTGFVAVTAGVEEDEADRLLDQHIMGGGDIDTLLPDFLEALQSSPFFKKMLENSQKRTAPAQAEKTGE